MSDFNTQIIDEFHENDGTVSAMGFGRNLVVLHSTGAKSGADRVSPLLGLPDGAGGRFIIGSAAGSPKNPSWVYNLRKNPHVTVEWASDGSGIETHSATATELDPAAREQAWQAFTSMSSQFIEYTKTAQGRVFPIFRLTPTD